MNEITPINSELLCADARGRKHIPVAVFAVILIHVVLFGVLLVAAGCRASARAKANLPADETMAQQSPPESAVTAPPEMKSAPAPAALSEPVVATEPVVEPEIPRVVAQVEPRPLPRLEQQAITRPAARSSSAVYVVQAGDTVDKIAKRHGTTIQAINTANQLKNHVIRPGQKLRLKPAGSAGALPYQAKTTKPKRSNEV